MLDDEVIRALKICDALDEVTSRVCEEYDGVENQVHYLMFPLRMAYEHQTDEQHYREILRLAREMIERIEYRLDHPRYREER